MKPLRILVGLLMILLTMGLAFGSVTHTLNAPDNYLMTTDTTPMFNWTATSTVNSSLTSWLQHWNGSAWKTNFTQSCTNNTACYNDTVTYPVGFVKWQVVTEDNDVNYTSTNRWIEIRTPMYNTTAFTIYNDTRIEGTLNVTGDTYFHNNVSITGNLSIGNDLNVGRDLHVVRNTTTGNLTVEDDGIIGDILRVLNDLFVTDDSFFGGGYGSTGLTIFDNGNLSTDGDIIIGDDLFVGDDATVSGDLYVTTHSYFGGGYGSTGLTIFDNGNLYTNGDILLDGTFITINGQTVNGSMIPIDALTELVTLGNSSNRWNVFAGDVNITPNSARTALYIDQDNNAVGLTIDSESTTQAGIKVNGYIPARFEQDITSGYGLFVTRNINEIGTTALVVFKNDHATDTFPTLSLQNDGSGAHITTGATNEDLEIDPDGTGGVKIIGGDFIVNNSDMFVDVSTGYVGIGDATPTSKLDVDGDVNISDTSTNRLILPTSNDAVTPTLSFGDGDTGFYESSDGTLVISIDTFVASLMTNTLFQSAQANGFFALDWGNIASATNPVWTFRADEDTGLGKAGADALSLIAGAWEGIRINGTSKEITHAGNMTISGDLIPSSNNSGYIGYGNKIWSMANVNEIYINEPPAACSASFGVNQFLGNTSTCTHFMLGTGDEVAGNYTINGTATIQPVGAHTGLFIDQDYNAVSLSIDSEATTARVLDVYGKYVGLFTQDIADGRGLYVSRNINDAEINPLVAFINDHTSDTKATVSTQNDGTGPHFTTGGTNENLEIDPNGIGGTVFVGFVNLNNSLIATSTEVNITKDLMLSGGSQDYLITDRSASLSLQGQTSATASIFDLFSKDGDGTDDLSFRVWGKGSPTNIVNREELVMSWNAATSQYEVWTEADGTGTLRPLAIYTEGNTRQLRLETNGQVVLNGSYNSAANPTLAFGDGDSGIYESSDDTLIVTIGGVNKWIFTSNDFEGALGGSPTLKNVDSTATVPNFFPDQGDTNTGIGSAGLDALSLIAGGVEIMRLNDTTAGITINRNVTISGATHGMTLYNASNEPFCIQMVGQTLTATSGAC